MYKSIEQIRNLKKEKENILKKVYQSNDPNVVYKNQRELGSMAIGIFSDVANAIMPTLQEDGVSNLVWSAISLRLKKLSFISVPTEAEIREKYKKSIKNPTVVKVDDTRPETYTKTKVKKIPIPAFLALLIAQGIAVPLLLNFIGGKKWALVKIVSYTINTAFMVIEVVKYFNLIPSKKKKTASPTYPKAPAPTASTDSYTELYKRAIEKAYFDNLKRLNDWFDELEKIATEEIENALNSTEG